MPIGEARYCSVCRTLIIATLMDVPHFCPICEHELTTIDIGSFTKLLRVYGMPTFKALAQYYRHDCLKPNLIIIVGRDSP